jgi:hypothetical protein
LRSGRDPAPGANADTPNRRGFKRTLHQSFGELLEEPVFPNYVFKLFVICQQAVYQFVTYGHFPSFENIGSYLPVDVYKKSSTRPQPIDQMKPY